MPLLQNQNPPNVPLAPAQYDQGFMNQFANVLRLFFNQINAVQQLNLAKLNLDLYTLPTDVDYPNLRYGDVYRETDGGTLKTGVNILKIKVPIIPDGVQASGGIGSVSASKTIALSGVNSGNNVGSVTP